MRDLLQQEDIAVIDPATFDDDDASGASEVGQHMDANFWSV